MADELERLVDLIRKADAEDGWKLRTPGNIDFLNDEIGQPLEAKVAPGNLTPAQGQQGHADKPRPTAQFLYQVRFVCPSELWPRVRNFVDGPQAEGAASVERVMTYLGLTVSHRWQNAKHRQPAHLRYGFEFEADRKHCDAATRVLGSEPFRERLAKQGAPDLSVGDVRPVPGVSLMSARLGRSFTAEELRDAGPLAALVARAANGLVALYRALAKD
jgi:hypothetical protein